MVSSYPNPKKFPAIETTQMSIDWDVEIGGTRFRQLSFLLNLFPICLNLKMQHHCERNSLWFQIFSPYDAIALATYRFVDFSKRYSSK